MLLGKKTTQLIVLAFLCNFSPLGVLGGELREDVLLQGAQLWQDLQMQGLNVRGISFFLEKEGMTKDEIHEVQRRMEAVHESTEKYFSQSQVGICSIDDHCITNLCSSHDCDASNLAIVLRGKVGEHELLRLEAFVENAKKNGPRSLVKERRNFGYTASAGGGHEVTYLHQDAPESVLDLFWGLARAADERMPAWGIANRISGSRPRLRCLEAIDYFASPAQSGNSTDANDISWHNDGATLFTVSVARSTTGQNFEGGELQFFKPPNVSHTFTVNQLSRGDVVVWKGWIPHRVLPVRGRREVVVAEWWLGPACSGEDARPDDTLAAIRQALKFDNTSVELQFKLADALEGRKDWQSAVRQHQAILRLHPISISPHIKLGSLLPRFGKLQEAHHHLQIAMQISPQDSRAYDTARRLLTGLRKSKKSSA